MSNYKISDEDGVSLVRAARSIVTEFVKSGRKIKLDENERKRFSFECGIFVTLEKESDLRGCIGFPLPRRLDTALPEAAIAAATNDPRFPPVTVDELDKITFEVTVLTPPVELKVEPSQIPSSIKVGRDGLIVKQGPYSGLLLPQVPVEYGWNEQEFLAHTCQKAGLPQDCWKKEDTRVFSFEGIIFRESSPNGQVVRHFL
ncbi:TIGR00296 family protein [Candidatus Nitrosotenuis uzonensis]|nr:TIGR00296 family protein [Candidatus Nitrosotenuis uzonensis]